MPESPTVFVVHIPKTAGTALRHNIREQVPREKLWQVYDWNAEGAALQADKATIDSYRYVIGHFRVSVWTPFQDDYPMVTILRDPVERAVSLYRYTHAATEHPLNRQIRGMSVAEFAQDPSVAFPNYMTYVLSTRLSDGRPHQEDAGKVDRRDLDEALGYLRRKNVLVGLTEHFDELLALMSVRFDLDPVSVKANVTPGRRVVLDASLRESMATANDLDLELYDEARDHFWDLWRDAGSEATQALERIRGRRATGLRVREQAWAYATRARRFAQRVAHRA